MTVEATGTRTFKGVSPVGSAVLIGVLGLGLWWLSGPLSAAIDAGSPEWLLAPRAWAGVAFVAFGLWSTTRHPRWIEIDPAQRQIAAWTGLGRRWNAQSFEVNPGDRVVIRSRVRPGRRGGVSFNLVLVGEGRSEVIYRWPERALSREIAAALGEALGLTVVDETQTQPG